MKCPKCKHHWKPRTEKPLRCPRCGKWLKLLAVVAATVSLLGCAHQKNGLEMYADGMDCMAQYGYTKECEAMRERGLAQALREAGSGVDYGPSMTVNVQ